MPTSLSKSGAGGIKLEGGVIKGGKKLLYVIDLIFFALLIAADQLTKRLAYQKLRGQEDFIFIDGVFQLHYLENRGAAFSMFQDARLLFVLATVIMLVVVLYLLMKVPPRKRYLIWHITLTMIAAGGIGNLIDRLRLTYVVDFLYFSLIDFPVFNVADICVTVGVGLLVIWIVFIWKDDDLKFMDMKLRPGGKPGTDKEAYSQRQK